MINGMILDGDVPRSPYYGVYIFLSLFVLLECVLMLIISTTETYFFKTAKLLKQSYRYHKI